MVTPSKPSHRATVALGLPKKGPVLIVYAQGIVERLTGNPSFPTPTVWSQPVSLMVEPHEPAAVLGHFLEQSMRRGA
jgi:hypothetical protein